MGGRCNGTDINIETSVPKAWYSRVWQMPMPPFEYKNSSRGARHAARLLWRLDGFWQLCTSIVTQWLANCIGNRLWRTRVACNHKVLYSTTWQRTHKDAYHLGWAGEVDTAETLDSQSQSTALYAKRITSKETSQEQHRKQLKYWVGPWPTASEMLHSQLAPPSIVAWPNAG